MPENDIATLEIKAGMPPHERLRAILHNGNPASNVLSEFHFISWWSEWATTASNADPIDSEPSKRIMMDEIEVMFRERSPNYQYRKTRNLKNDVD